ncbi:MAG: hypothetical protein V1846_04420 [Candidatus Komeilibacteria bacterium]
MVINTTLDIFWLVLAICAVAITFFLCWMMFYVVNFLRKTSRIINRVEAITSSIHEATQAMRRKTEDLATYIPLIIRGGAELKSVIEKFTDKKSKRGKRQSEEKEK